MEINRNKELKMNISIYQKEVFEKYHSKSQIARVLTENWFKEEMYCPACLNEELSKNPNNTKVTDFCCNNCANCFQLKSQTSMFHHKAMDGAFNPMFNAILRNIIRSAGAQFFASYLKHLTK